MFQHPGYFYMCGPRWPFYFISLPSLFTSIFCFWLSFFFNLPVNTKNPPSQAFVHTTTCMILLNVCIAVGLYALALSQVNVTLSDSGSTGVYSFPFGFLYLCVHALRLNKHLVCTNFCARGLCEASGSHHVGATLRPGQRLQDGIQQQTERPMCFSCTHHLTNTLHECIRFCHSTKHQCPVSPWATMPFVPTLNKI